MPHRPSPATKERSSPEPPSNSHRQQRHNYEMGDIPARRSGAGGYSDDEEMRLTAEELGTDAAGRETETGPSPLWNEQAQAAESSPIASKGRQLFGLNLSDAAVVRHLSINAVLIGLWYFFSLSISLYNQWMFSGRHLDFKFPLFTTCMHMLVQFILASLVLYFFPRYRPQAASQDLSSSQNSHDSDSKKPLMTRAFYLTRIGPCGAATGLDIGLGNTSMRFITLTFYTMCKSSVLGFVLLFAFLFRLERPSLKLLGIIAVMTGGVILMVAGETAFSLKGFLLILSAAAFSGLRWSLTQILLLRNAATSNPFSSLFFLAPIMFATLLVIAVPVETVPAVVAGLRELAAKQGTLRGVLLLLFPGTLAFCMTASEFALLKRTSVVTLSVCGIFKEVVTIIAAQSTLDHDRMTAVNLAGLAITIASIATYNYMKIKKMRAEAQEELTGTGKTAASTQEYAPVGADDPDLREDRAPEERPMLGAREEDDEDQGSNGRGNRTR